MELALIFMLSALLSLQVSLPVLGWLWSILGGEEVHDCD
jgi:hypothetical protein